MLVIDGSRGEGGGQILRTALSLSLLTNTPFRIENIRAGRAKPGLLRQHLTAVQAACAISSSHAAGGRIAARELTFTPRPVKGGTYRFAIGTAGSATLVLQTILPPLLAAAEPSTLTLEGGTHNPFAPPFDFLEKVFLPLVSRMGPRVTARLERPGFYPAGGGLFTVAIEPAALRPLELTSRGALTRTSARAFVSSLSPRIGHRELEVVSRLLGLPRSDTRFETVRSAGPGNVVMIEVESANVTELFCGFGERGVPAEAVAEKAANEALRYLASGAPVGEHLADQLLLPMVLAKGGAFVTLPLSLHATTNLDVIEAFTGRRPRVVPAGETVRVESD